MFTIQFILFAHPSLCLWMIHCKRSYIILIKNFLRKKSNLGGGKEGTKIKRARPRGGAEPRGKRVREWGAESEGKGSSRYRRDRAYRKGEKEEL